MGRPGDPPGNLPVTLGGPFGDPSVARRGDEIPAAHATFDVVVIGAGPAGCAAARTLAMDGRSVLLVDQRRDPPAFRVGEGAPPGFDQAVDQVFGTGAFVTGDHLRSYGNRAVWGSPRPGDTDFMFNPFGAGWHLDRVAFDQRLRHLAQTAGALLWTGAATARDAEHLPFDRVWTLRIDAPEGTCEVVTSIVCDATGRRAAFARGHGGEIVVDDRLVAVVAVARCDAVSGEANGLDTRTTIEATEGGWWYSAAIPGERRVIAFFTDGDLVPPGLRSTDGFLRGLRDAAPLVAGLVPGAATAAILVAPPELVAAGTTHLVRPSGRGWLAAGDAAAAFDPLSSQGLLTAILMGRAAGDAAISLLVDPHAGTAVFDARYRTLVDRYLDEQRATYAVERRWSDAPFWSRRVDRSNHD